MGVGVETRAWQGGDPVMLTLSYLILSLALLPTSDAVLNMGNPDAKRLYDDLLSNYNKLVRPVQNTTDPLTVRIKLKLSQLIDVVSLSFIFCLLRPDFVNNTGPSASNKSPLTFILVTSLLAFLSFPAWPGLAASNIKLVISRERETAKREREGLERHLFQLGRAP